MVLLPSMAVIYSALAAVPLDIASLEAGLSVAGSGVSVVASVSRLFNAIKSRRSRPPKRQELDLSRAKAYYIIRSMQMVRIPTNLERPPESDEEEQVLQEASPEPIPDGMNQVVPKQPRLLRSKHLYVWRQQLHNLHTQISIFRPHLNVRTQKPKIKSRRSQIRMWWQREHVHNVLSADDALLYTFERYKKGVWMMYSYPQRELLATIRFRKTTALWGPNHRGHSIEYHHGRPAEELGRRKIRRKSTVFDHYNVFYTNDGAPYHWATNTRRLERVTNYGGKENEVRQVVAQAKPLRRHQLNYELLIDDTLINPVVALTTGFVSMKTQWALNDCPVAQNKTRLSPV
ncbi:hypothetical protein V1525DRAFT_403456 [Lipomyces kononenkoae]|uniref:Uncharacterized protein n=1 Tax=Lipomyces kononenkoae TaxID=34357 RepID=A0ACC3T194_LIPKO